jgi:hypothetical protein
MCMFCRSLFVLLSSFSWPLCCLSFDLRILITSFVSSNSSSWLLSCDVRYDFHGKTMFGSTSFPLVLLTFVLYLRYLYLFTHTVVYVDFIMIWCSCCLTAIILNATSRSGTNNPLGAIRQTFHNNYWKVYLIFAWIKL